MASSVLQAQDQRPSKREMIITPFGSQLDGKYSIMEKVVKYGTT